MGADPNAIDKNELYGKFQAQDDADNEYHNGRRKWEDDYKKKLIHKSTDMAITPETEDMNVDARKSYSTSANGLDWKHLAVLAAAGLGTLGIFKFSPSTPTPTTPPAISIPAPIKQDYTTQIEIRDKLTGKPIKVDWINGDNSSK